MIIWKYKSGRLLETNPKNPENDRLWLIGPICDKDKNDRILLRSFKTNSTLLEYICQDIKISTPRAH